METARILSDLYGAGYQAGRLVHALDSIRERTGAFCVTLHWFRRTHEALQIVRQEGCSNAPHELQDLRLQNPGNPRTLASVNPFREEIQWLEDSAFPPQLFDRIEQWQALLAEMQMGTFLGARIACGSQHELGLALHARVGCDGFRNGTQDLMLELMPHVRESMGLLKQAEQRQVQLGAVSGAIDKLNCALLVGNADGRIVHINKAGRKLLEEVHLLPVESARLMPEGELAAGKLLHILLTGAEKQGPMELRVRDRRLLVHSMSLSDAALAQGEDTSGPQPVLFAFATDDTMPSVQTEQVRRYFALTPREADLLVALCRGLDPAGYASHAGISIHTARSQLKNLMGKMNARRQSDLVRMTLSSPLGLFGPSS